jgi:hypothetical protein
METFRKLLPISMKCQMKNILVVCLMMGVQTGLSQQCVTGSVTLTATASPTNNQVSLSWTSISIAGGWDYYGAATYYVHYGIGNLNSTFLPGTTGNSVTITGLTWGATYSFRIHVTQTCGLNDGSGLTGTDLDRAVSGIVLATIIPAVPTIATKGVSNSSTSIDCLWNAVAGATGYDVEVTNSAGSVVQNPVNVPGQGTYTATGLTANTNYFYRIRARNGTGTSVGYSPKSEATFTRPDAPVIPQTSASAITTTSFKANWLAVSGPGAVSYRLDVSTDPNFNSFVVNEQTVNGTISPDITGLAGGTTYHFRIRAVNESGASANSLTSTVLTAPVTPTGFTVSSTSSTSISVNWVNSAAATQYELFVSVDPSFNLPIANYNPKVINDPIISDVITGLTTGTTYYLRVRAKNGSNSFSDYAYTSAVPNASVGIQLNASAPGVYIPGTAKDLTVDVTGTSGSVIVTLYHKRNSETTYSTNPATLANGSTYKVALDDSWFDDFGMDFYFKAQDQVGMALSSRTNIAAGVSNVLVPLESFGNQVKDYQIISIPYQLPGRLHVSDVFEQVTGLGNYDKKKWRLFSYQDGNYVEYSDGVGASDLKQGHAYWFITKNEITLSLGEGHSNNSIDDQTPFTILLKKGWNLIGNPFPYTISWNDVLNANPGFTTELMVFDKKNVSLSAEELLKVFSGGFVFSDGNTSLNFPVTLQATGGRIRSNDEGDLPAEDPLNWVLPISLVQGEVTNTVSGIGMNASAQAGKDRYDRVTPPRFMRYLEFNSKSPDFDYDLSQDVVDPRDNHKWSFRIESNSNETVQLNWNKQMVPTHKAQLILHDQTKQVLIDMAKCDTYSTVSGANITIHYRSSFQIEMDYVELGKPYPNPFSREITIPFDYSVEANSHGELTVIDLSGRIIAQVVADLNDQSAIKSIRWNGDTHSGGQVAAGVYIYQLRLNRGTETLTFNGKIIKQ